MKKEDGLTKLTGGKMNRKILSNIASFLLMILLIIPLLFIGTPLTVFPTTGEVEDGNEADEPVKVIDFSISANTQTRYYVAVPAEYASDDEPRQRSVVKASKWVNGTRIDMSEEEVTDFEKGLYDTKTKEEYIKYLEESDIAHYDKGIDLSAFEWTWTEMKSMYADHRVDIVRYSKPFNFEMPNIVGMSAQKIYELLDGMGALVRFYYYYSPDANVPVGHCYFQDPEVRTIYGTNCGVMVTLQAPKEIVNESVGWDPDDNSFDIEAIARDIRENGSYAIYVPDLIGLNAEDSKKQLNDLGFVDVRIDYSYYRTDIEPGIVYEQSFTPGEMRSNRSPFTIFAGPLPSEQIVVPDVVGMTMDEALALIEGRSRVLC